MPSIDLLDIDSLVLESDSQHVRWLVVSRPLLDQLAALSTKGDPEIGRKAAATPEPITPEERDWLEAVVVRLIRRVGKVAAGGDTLRQITIGDFPPIPSPKQKRGQPNTTRSRP